jgi:hypothetical protein
VAAVLIPVPLWCILYPYFIPAKKSVLCPIPRPDWYWVQGFRVLGFGRYPMPVPAWYGKKNTKNPIPGPGCHIQKWILDPTLEGRNPRKLHMGRKQITFLDSRKELMVLES